MPETPEELWQRAHASLQLPPVGEWETFPFDGDLRLRALARPVEREQPRRGEGGVDCHSCRAVDGDYLWTDANWRLRPLREPRGLPVVVLIESRLHVGEPGDLPDELAGDLGRMLARAERAVRAVPGVGRVHVCRWGDGSEHLHWWLMARPARLEQLIGSFAAVWDDVLPPTPVEVWRANLAIISSALAAG